MREINQPQSQPQSQPVSEQLPRWDLREPQCQRFEHILATAINMGRIELTPSNMAELINCRKRTGMTTRTLYCRLNDAILGYTRYQYPSKLIKDLSQLRHLKVRELVGEKVEVVSTLYLSQAAVAKLSTPTGNDLEAWRKKVLEVGPSQEILEVLNQTKEVCDAIMAMQEVKPELDYTDWRPDINKVVVRYLAPLD